MSPIRKAERLTRPIGYWGDVENRRRFLFEFAEEMGFDPMVSANWLYQRQNLQANGVTFKLFVLLKLTHSLRRGVACLRDMEAM